MVQRKQKPTLKGARLRDAKALVEVQPDLEGLESDTARDLKSMAVDLNRMITEVKFLGNSVRGLGERLVALEKRAPEPTSPESRPLLPTHDHIVVSLRHVREVLEQWDTKNADAILAEINRRFGVSGQRE